MKKKKVEFHNPWPDWAKSEEGERCRRWRTLGMLNDKDAETFLENRLWAAFTAGYNWPHKSLAKPKRTR